MTKSPLEKSPSDKAQAGQKHFAAVDPKVSFPKVEHEMLEFWEREDIFKKSLFARKDKPKYVFFDGPPFANGLPHYGHILANALKDAVTRYWTMRGYYVPRVNGWDCHGLPVEYEIEKELKISGRKEIQKMGIAKFNNECRKSVFRYTEEWEKLLKRIGRWVDFEHSYATLENEYMESIWWVFNEIWKKKMVYQGFKTMHICPRCETPLSNFEVTQGYKDIAELSVYIKLKLKLEKNTFFLAWTTTPWTLPGNVALAVGKNIDYITAQLPGGEKVILCEDRKELLGEEYKVIKKMKGKDLLGIQYEPLFEIKELQNDKSHRVIPAEFVTTEDGTGIVHTAAMYGEDDFIVCQANGIPLKHTVDETGRFNELVKKWQGELVKSCDQKIAQDLEERGLLFKKETYKHSYPHCWRCDTPLLNYATKAWFIKVTDIKNKLLKNNKKIHWVPDHIKEGRFGKWLEGARDWNVSRNRFWGCPIPIWECECGEKKCIGSLKELRENSMGGNTFYVVRHGEAEQNIEKKLNSNPAQVFNLTKQGREQVLKAATKLQGKNVDMIFCSQFPRAEETANIFAEKLNVKVTVDDHLREHEMGMFDGKSEGDYIRSFADLQERYYKKVEGGESFHEMEKRVIEFVNYLNRKYSGKRIIIVTHGNVIRAIARYFDRLSVEETFGFKPGLAAINEYKAGNMPLRGDKLDLHKPYIDEVELACNKCGKTMKRISEVLDCWFESGSMPYAQLHYPFENKKEFEANFPAHFIAEGLDQTRGWFYTLHVLSTILFDKPAFNNVIVNGILLAANGEKLSKRKKNYPDPSTLFETHGADSTRFFLYSSTTPIGEDVRFSEKHVEDVVKKFTLTLWNTYSFFVTYANIDGWHAAKPHSADSEAVEHTKVGANRLDEWILSELNVLVDKVTRGMDEYNLTEATRPMLDFVDNLSNWYIRRSRRRFWKSENDGDKVSAYATLYEVLTKLSLLLAPFMPATADAIYKNLAGPSGRNSVHLADWPKVDKKYIKNGLNDEVRTIRTIVSLALAIRGKKNIKVRQPLARLMLALPARVPQKLVESYRDVILEELNVKEIVFETEGKMATRQLTVDSRKIGPRFGKDTQEIIALSKKGEFEINKDGSVTLGRCKLAAEEFSIGYIGREGFDVESDCGILVGLDTKVTDELKAEGAVRDIVRFIQELRKKAGYGISDRIYVYVDAPARLEKAVTQFADFIKRETLAIELQEGGDFEWDTEEIVAIDGEEVKLGVKK